MRKIIERVLNDLTDQHAQGDLFFTTSKSLKMGAQKGLISEYKVSSSQVLGIRAIKEGKVGISYTEALDDESLSLLIKQALQNAESNEANKDEIILSMSGHLSDEAEYPEEEIEISFKTEKALELESGVKKLDSRVVAVPHNSYSENEFFSYYQSSHGRSAAYNDKTYSIISSALMDEGGKKASYYDISLSHTFKDLQWEKVIRHSFETARNLLTEKTLPTGKYDVRFSEDCLKNLIECFSNLYSAKSAMDKVNPWSEKVGSEVISKDLSICDEPLFEKSFRVTRFDSEGVARKSLTLIDEGVLKSLYHNSVTAAHFKTITTGHASRSATSSLNISGTHLVVKGKNVKPMPAKFLEVIQMDGLYSGANRVTGDFSVAVKGYAWENGKRILTFGNITLSGNLLKLLKQVEVVGEGLVSSTDGSFFSVPLIFYDLSIAGS